VDNSVTDELSPRARRYGLLVTAFAPVIPQVLGSAFNIWYNAIVIAPLLVTEEIAASLCCHRDFLQCRSLSGGGRGLDLCDPFAAPNFSRIDQGQSRRAGRARAGPATSSSPAMDCFCDFERGLARLHSCFYFGADHDGHSDWFPTSLASPDFVFGFGLHRSDANVFPG